MDSPNIDPTIDLPPSGESPPGETMPPADSAAALVSVLDRYLADLQAGKQPDRARLLADHPALAAQLEACLAGIDFVHGVTAGQAAEDRPAQPQLGDFRIVRELGRGGMGVVYEADQMSLRRRVALKVLRFGVVADPEAMQRFQREAETVAGLHHTNIVPIFAVGCERGVHFYAMQFIEGRSLAEVQAEAQRDHSPPTTDAVVRWGLQVAEALVHAHRRGVIHRDIKPSNLLLDHEGIVWLTDFGLAKRADETTMTQSGTLMGTPRYMSPEQVEALRHPVDARTDVYSLGATLYELTTGQPMFNAPTTHGLLAQILNEEPVHPRTLRAGFARDLETVILTCVAKDPAQRYQTAGALADDLRAVLDGRLIQARRAPWTERLARRLRTHRKTLKVAMIAVAAALLLMAALVAGTRWYSDWRLGRMLLSTDGPPLTAEVLPADGEGSLIEPFTIDRKTALALPAGDYRLRLKAPGRLGRTFRIGLNRGETLTRSVSLEEGLLYKGEAIPFVPGTEAVCFGPGKKADLVEWTGRTLIRRDGATGSPVWDLQSPETPWPAARDPLAWMRRLHNGAAEHPPGRIVTPAPDLNGDRVGDLVLAFQAAPALLALSGKDGSFLWAATCDDARFPPPKPGLGWIAGRPIAADVDGDQVPDVIATVVLAAAPRPGDGASVGGKGRRVLVAVSGQDGRRVWSRAIDAGDQVLDRKDERFSAVVLRGRSGPLLGVLASTAPLADAQLRDQGRSGVLVGMQGPGKPGAVRTFDVATGEPLRAPIALEFVPVRPLDVADLDGDGADELVALGPGVGLGLIQDQRLSAVSITSGRVLWSTTVRGGYYYSRSGNDPAPEWPLVADLDGNGRAEIAVPDWGDYPQAHHTNVEGNGRAQIAVPDWGRTSKGGYRGVALLDGATGKPLWSQPLRPWTYDEEDLQHLTTAPDLDGDGVRDLIAVSRFAGRDSYRWIPRERREPMRLYVDALSAKGGRPLWWWSCELANASVIPAPAQWWGNEAEGGQVLAVSVADTPTERPGVRLLAANSGRAVSRVVGLSAPGVADLDGDGRADLWGVVEGQLRAYRGAVPEVWRALGEWKPAGDLDGDGLADVLTGDLVSPNYAKPFIHPRERSESHTLATRSGRDGRELWRAALDFAASGGRACSAYRFFTFPGGCDFDGDGAPEIVVDMTKSSWDAPHELLLELRSGRTGQRLWSLPALPKPLPKIPAGYARDPGEDTLSELVGIEACDAGGTDQTDLLVVRRVCIGLRRPAGVKGLSPGASEFRLARIAVRDGRVVWDVPLEAVAVRRLWEMKLPPQLADVDGDGHPDLMVEVQVGVMPEGSAGGGDQDPRRIVAVSLREGKRLWSRPLGPDVSAKPASRRPGDAGLPRYAVSTDQIVCRLAVPSDVPGKPRPATVLAAGTLRHGEDPRWMRPLPWMHNGGYDVYRANLLIFLSSLVLLELVLSIWLVRTAWRQRPRSLPLWLALPMGLAGPLALLVTMAKHTKQQELWLPSGVWFGDWFAPAMVTGLALAGLPALVYPWAVLTGLFRRRWKRLAALLGGTLVASCILAAYMLRDDMRAMPELEFFDWSGWYEVLPCGAYCVGLVLLVGRCFSRLARRVRRRFGPGAAVG